MSVSAKIGVLLQTLKDDLSAGACIFYVRDPIWKNGFRLAGMVGVEHPEPMYGFSFPATAKDVISSGPREYFSENTRFDPLLREKSDTTTGIPQGKRLLFGDFVARERVRSCARLIHPNDSSAAEQAVLFVNFKTRTHFTGHLKEKIRVSFRQLTSLIPALREELLAADASALAKSAQILSPDSTISGESMTGISGGLNGYLEGILESAIKALGGNRKNTLGTIHLYDPHRKQLDLAAHIGPIRYMDRAKHHSVKEGQGVVSWVVLRRRALLIHDLKHSAYLNIHVSLNNRIKCELAAPMVSGGRVIGVICLESLRVGSFGPGDVRTLWYAANRAAVACRFYSQLSIGNRLLETCSAAISDPPGRNTLDELAAITKEHLDADLCDIWKYDAEHGLAGLAGSSYGDFTPNIRENGWSNWISSRGCPVWMFNVSKRGFKVLVQIDGVWKTPTSDLGCPKSVNPIPVGQGVRCELGLPIMSFGKCSGVAWVKYKTDHEQPTPDFMRWARGFSSQVALVLDVVRNRLELEQRRETEIRIQGRLCKKWDLPTIARFEGHCNSISSSGLGGDYCRAVSISKHRVGILVLDGEGHGLRGSLNMLPLAGAFTALHEFSSATYVMDRLIAVSHRTGARATALYTTFTESGDHVYVSATCAGHLPLILLRREGGILGQTAIPSLNHSARGGELGEKTTSPFTEELVELLPGDLIIGYTDGATETLSRLQLSALCEEALDAGQTPKAIADAIIDKVIKNRGPDDQADDTTVFVVKVK